MATAALNSFSNQQEHGHDGPTCDPILAIHRGKDSYVTLHLLRDKLQPDGTVKKVMSSDGAVRVEHLANMFPQFRAELETDAYFSINGFYRHAGFGNQGALRRITGLPHALRKSTAARYLNALYCDVDAYKIGIEPGMVVGRMLAMQDRGIIPPISIIVRSGQGVWAMWLLAAERGSDMPPKAHPHRQLLHGHLERELISRFAEFNVDKGTSDVARIARFPGSINSKCGLRVEYLFQTAGDGKVHMHTMEDVAAFLNVSTTHATRDPESGARSARSIAATRRLAATMESRLYDFRLLWRLRGRFCKGQHDALPISRCTPRSNCSVANAARRSATTASIAPSTRPSATLASPTPKSPRNSPSPATRQSSSRASPVPTPASPSSSSPPPNDAATSWTSSPPPNADFPHPTSSAGSHLAASSPTA